MGKVTVVGHVESASGQVRSATTTGADARTNSPSSPLEQAVNWHRYHYPVGIFLTLYGLTGLLSVMIGWSDHRAEIANYLTKTAGLDARSATPVLIGLHVVEALLVLITLTGLLRRRDVWFLPAIFGWMAGFAGFCVLDIWAGTMGLLAEHALYLVGFTAVLLVSYALGVKARVNPVPPPGRAGNELAPRNLSRTQEFALSTLNRWQRTTPPGQVRSPSGAENPPPVPTPTPAQTPADATTPDPVTAKPPTPIPFPAPAPAPAGQQHAPLPPPRRFPVTPPTQQPPS
jgi:hypothetical protein